MAQHDDLNNVFTYHTPKNDQLERCEAIRCLGKALAQYVLHAAPESRERSIALNNIEQAVMWANAAIARNE